MSTQSELFLRRAAECDRRGKVISDPEKKQMYKRLRDMWTWLACEKPRLTSGAVDELAATIVNMQSVLDRDKSGTVH